MCNVAGTGRRCHCHFGLVFNAVAVDLFIHAEIGVIVAGDVDICVGSNFVVGVIIGVALLAGVWAFMGDPVEDCGDVDGVGG